MKRESKKIITYSVVVVFFIGIVALLMSGSGGKVTQYSASSLSIVENEFDFGTIVMQEGIVSHNFEVRNDGVEPVVIKKVYTSCMCTEASITSDSGEKLGGPFGMPGHGLSTTTDVEIAAGSFAIIEVVYDPEAHGPSGVGLAQRSVYLETNSSQLPKLELRIQAIVARR